MAAGCVAIRGEVIASDRRAGLAAVSSNRRSVTQALELLSAGTSDRGELEERLYGLVYDELRSMARSLLRREQQDVALRPTELVHEAYLRLVDFDSATWESRAHFFGAAGRAMRQILVDQARKRGSAKRGAGWRRVTLDPGLFGREEEEMEIDILALDQALTRLSDLDRRMANVVELRMIAGMKSREVAAALGVSLRTVDGDWSFAKKWLRRELAAG